jgi:AbrB family looped-hinge helix DNA binding protein
MKIGFITKSNDKGQIVIPKEMRDALGIDGHMSLNLIMRGKGIYIYPIAEIVGAADMEHSYLKILEKTKGAWKGASHSKTASFKAKKAALERAASKKRKRSW